jgi:two-component system, OmpR family, alkaline phosphatase synthesis response regulator PhoP
MLDSTSARQAKPDLVDMQKSTILIVDDETDILDLIEYNLNKEGFRVMTAEDGERGLEQMRTVKPDLVLLDIMMPRMDGITVVEHMRNDEELQDIPVIFLTARSDEKTEVRGLDVGADDFLTKPISTAKLVSRIKAVLRRTSDEISVEKVLVLGDLTIDKDRYMVTRAGKEYHLPRKEFELLYYLATRRGKVHDRQSLLNAVWGNNVYVIDRTIDVHVRKIREKLGDDYIETVKGVGYRFKD